MPGDPFAKVSSGKPFRMSADAYNAFVDAAKAHRSRDADGQFERSHRIDGTTLVKNVSGSDQSQFAVMGIKQPLVGSAVNLDEFKTSARFEVDVPNVPSKWSPSQGEQDHRAAFVVLAEPINAGEIGLAYISHACPVQVTCVDDKEYRSAIPIDGDTAKLQCSDVGTVRLRLGRCSRS